MELKNELLEFLYEIQRGKSWHTGLCEVFNPELQVEVVQSLINKLCHEPLNNKREEMNFKPCQDFIIKILEGVIDLVEHKPSGNEIKQAVKSKFHFKYHKDKTLIISVATVKGDYKIGSVGIQGFDIGQEVYVTGLDFISIVSLK